MKEKYKIKRSPFFYVGDKFKLISEIGDLFPKKINTFVEPFLGGGSVFLNTEAKKYILNDIDVNIINLHRFLVSNSKKENKFFSLIKHKANEFGLSLSAFGKFVSLGLKKEWNKTYYAKYNRNGYEQLKSFYNKTKKKDPLLLYLLLIYGFNRILRFNKKGEFNVPVGNVDFNKNVLAALQDYFNTVNGKNITFYSKDFKSFLLDLKLQKDDFVYVDPPYLISASEYNKLWNQQREEELYKTLDLLNQKGIKFALSNVVLYNGKENKILIEWMKKYKSYIVNSNYISYHDNTRKKIIEVLVVNY